MSWEAVRTTQDIQQPANQWSRVQQANSFDAQVRKVMSQSSKDFEDNILKKSLEESKRSEQAQLQRAMSQSIVTVTQEDQMTYSSLEADEDNEMAVMMAASLQHEELSCELDAHLSCMPERDSAPAPVDAAQSVESRPVVPYTTHDAPTDSEVELQAAIRASSQPVAAPFHAPWQQSRAVGEEVPHVENWRDRKEREDSQLQEAMDASSRPTMSLLQHRTEKEQKRKSSKQDDENMQRALAMMDTADLEHRIMQDTAESLKSKGEELVEAVSTYRIEKAKEKAEEGDRERQRQSLAQSQKAEEDELKRAMADSSHAQKEEDEALQQAMTDSSHDHDGLASMLAASLQQQEEERLLQEVLSASSSSFSSPQPQRPGENVHVRASTGGGLRSLAQLEEEAMGQGSTAEEVQRWKDEAVRELAFDLVIRANRELVREMRQQQL